MVDRTVLEDQIPLWDAINQVVSASGGNPGAINVRRMNAVVAVNTAVEAIVQRRVAATHRELLESLRALVPSDEQEAGWWCRQCVAETGATNDERCVNCGEPFGDPHEAEAIRAARAAIARAEGNA